MKTYRQKGNTNFLILNHKTSTKVSIKNVIFIKGEINYSIFYLHNGREKLVAHSIKFFEEYLQTQGFLRTHRAYMINPSHIIDIDDNKENLIMSNGQTASISRRKRHILKDVIN
jgi:DNA-binding LytR/AlgR family response regulator